ncbi:hypothetical protein MHYP_G00124040 [Metynnis hypsauchen]
MTELLWKTRCSNRKTKPGHSGRKDTSQGPSGAPPPKRMPVTQHLKSEGTPASRMPTLPRVHRGVCLSHMSISGVVKAPFGLLLPSLSLCFERSRFLV